MPLHHRTGGVPRATIRQYHRSGRLSTQEPFPRWHRLGSGQGARQPGRHDEVGFELAATVLRDPLAVSVYDEAHSETEDHWITLGQPENGQLLVVVYTFDEIDAESAHVRLIPPLISARKATAHERRQYQDR